MNISIKEDLKNNKMEFTIRLDKRTMVKQSHITLGGRKVKTIVDKEYKCPDTHILGECLNDHLKMDNEVDSQLEKTYVFNLIPKKTKKPITKKSAIKSNAKTSKPSSSE